MPCIYAQYPHRGVGKRLGPCSLCTQSTFPNMADGTNKQLLHIWRSFLFLGYFAISIYLLVTVWTADGCYVRHTYKQEFLASFASNPFYSATQIIREPPKSIHEEHAHMAVKNMQRASDIAAFPVGIEDPVSNAAFWPVKLDPMLNIDTLFKNSTVYGGVEDMLKVIMGQDEYRFLNASLAGLLDNPFIQLIENVPVVEPNNTPPMPHVPGTYHLTKNGIVVAPDLPLVDVITPFITSLRAQSLTGVSTGGVLPNIARCVPPLELAVDETGAQKDLKTKDWLREIADIATYSHRRGSCLLTGQQNIVDVSSNFKTSLSLFSSVNTLYLTLVVVWISASFAVFYIRLPFTWGSFDKKEESSWGSSDVTVAVPIVWNLVLIIFSVLPVVYNDKNIPLNNIFIGIGMLFVTIVTQAVWGNTDVINQADANSGSDDDQDGKKDDVAEVTRIVGYDGVPEESAMRRQNVFTSRRFLNFSNTSAGYSQVYTNAIATNYIDAIQKNEQNDQLRFVEYAITTPLLFALIMGASSNIIPTFVAQMTFVTFLIFHIMCIVITKFSQLVNTITKDDQNKENFGVIAMQGAFVAYIIGALMFGMGIYMFVHYTQRVEDLFETDTNLTAGVWVLVAMEVIFAVTVYVYSFVHMFGWDTDDGNGGKWLRKIVVTIYGVVNIIAKIVIVIIIMATATNGRFPGKSCSIWADLQ